MHPGIDGVTKRRTVKSMYSALPSSSYSMRKASGPPSFCGTNAAADEVAPKMGMNAEGPAKKLSTSFEAQFTRMYLRSYQGRSVVFSEMTFVCSPVRAL